MDQNKCTIGLHNTVILGNIKRKKNAQQSLELERIQDLNVLKHLMPISLCQGFPNSINGLGKLFLPLMKGEWEIL